MLNLKKIYHVLLVLYPILSGYGFSVQADFGVISIFVVGLLCAVQKKEVFQVKFFRGYVLFFLSALMLSLIFVHSIPLRLLLFTLNLIIALHCVDVELLKKYYFRLVPICCVFFILQEVSFYLTGRRISGLTTLLPNIYGMDGYVQKLRVAPRSASFFLEPSYFAQFLFPYIAVMLFSNTKKGVKNALMVSLIMLMIRSGNGIILLGIIWMLWFVLSRMTIFNKIAMCVLVFITGALMFLVNSESALALFSRTSEITNVSNSFGGDGESSGFIRFFRGYYLFADMPLMNKLFGADDALVTSMMRKSIFLWNRDIFMNGIQTLLIYNGVFVCVLYVRHLLLLLKGALKKKELFILVLGFIYLMFSESYYLCSRAFLTLLLIYGYIQDDLSSRAKLSIRLFKKG